MKKILVIEDNKNEREKARKAVKEFYCFIAEDLHEALLSLGQEEEVREIEGEMLVPTPVHKIKWDGVITDLYFPMIFTGDIKSEGKAEPYGLEIAILCYKSGIPCVICTDIDHHHSGWLKRVARHLNAEVADDKDWKKAVDLIKAKIKWEDKYD